MAGKQSIQILIVLISIAILVGIVNIYFYLQSDNHVLESPELVYEPSETLEEGEVQQAETQFDESDRKTPEASTSGSEKVPEAESRSTSQNAGTSETPKPPATPTDSGIREIDIQHWVKRSIPLTFESGGGAADSIKKQYAHVVRDLERVQQHLLEGNSEAAMSLIRPMLWDRSNIYREDAEWYQILTLLAAKNYDSGLNQLNRLLRDNMHLYYFLATELHGELVPIQTILQRSSERERQRDRGTGY